MNALFPEPRAIAPYASGEDAVGRRARARLRFTHAGGRSVLTEQFVPYPLHITRPFHLDRERPDLATLYLQSASGGLYRGDDIHIAVHVEPHAAMHVTTQAATLVHDTEDRPARQALNVAVDAGGFAALTMDPMILLPSAELAAVTEASVHPDGCLILADGFALHDPFDAGRMFRRIVLQTRLTRPDGALLLLDRGTIEAADIERAQGALGSCRAAGTLLMVAQMPPDENLIARMEDIAGAAGCMAGITTLPNAAGLAARMLAPDAGRLSRGLDALFVMATEKLLGFTPARRRK